MPNCTYRSSGIKNSSPTASLQHKNTESVPDTESGTPYQVRYRTLLCCNAAKKLSVTFIAPLILPTSCLTFKLSEFLFTPFTKTFHFNLAFLRTTPDLVIGYCCFLI